MITNRDNLLLPSVASSRTDQILVHLFMLLTPNKSLQVVLPLTGKCLTTTTDAWASHMADLLVNSSQFCYSLA